MDFDAQIAFAKKVNIDLTIIGPEAPLVEGVVDLFRTAGLRCFGPSAKGARLEGSKTFTKDFLADHQIPTAAYGSFEQAEAAIDYARLMNPPIVIKADGLAAGKGVVIARNHEEAEVTIRDMMEDKTFGDAGARVVVEEFCFLGLNCCVRDHVRVATECVIGAGATIKKDTEPSCVYGQPGTPVSRRDSSEVQL